MFALLFDCEKLINQLWLKKVHASPHCYAEDVSKQVKSNPKPELLTGRDTTLKVHLPSSKLS